MKKLRGMYWNIVLLLSAFGLVMGFLSVNGYIQKIEPLIWLVGGMFSAFILARNISSNLFFYALSTGLLWGV